MRSYRLPAYPVCPTCGSRVGSGVKRCLVCGAELTKPGPDPRRPRVGFAANLLPTLLPMGAVLLLLSLGCYFLLGAMGVAPLPTLPTAVPTETATPTETNTPAPTETPTPTPPPTPLPPIEYIIQPNDSILELAIRYDVAPWAINELNNLQPDAILSVGMKILIPHPSPTPLPSSTPTPGPSPTPSP